jgi:hypothetical protein
MLVKLKTGEILKISDIAVDGTVLNGTDTQTGQITLISPAVILVIIDDTLTLWDILRGLFFKLQQLFKLFKK